MLALVALVMIATMGPWLAVSAATSAMQADLGLSVREAAWLTMMVQLGFVAGTLAIAVTGAADAFSAPKLMTAGAFIAAAGTAGLAVTGSTAALMLLRFAAGIGLACIYPPGMKLAASWFRERRGTALGVIVAALVAGKAFPFLLAALTDGWRAQLLLLAALSAAGGVIAAIFAREGPYTATAARLDPRAIAAVIGQRETRLATFGYLGHMWELYAMWTWFGVFAAASFTASETPDAARAGSIAAFIAIGAGAAGAIAAGHWADRYGRARIAAGSLVISGACCLAAGFVFGAPAWLVYTLAAIWGFTVVADSAQFSALVTEHSPRMHVGTALTLQTCAGFLLTTISMRWLPALADSYGWQWAFLLLVPGPIAGLIAMRQLRR
ncbi:MAG: MFS transporter [Acidobacteriota bacterium]|nr:MFS transporter [Acidobacteriota bacterium]